MTKRLNASPGLSGVLVHDWLLGRGEVAPGAKLAYAALARRSDGRGMVAGAHMRELARELGVGEEEAARYLVELDDRELVRIKRHREVSALYRCTFLRHPWMDGAAVGEAGERQSSPRAPLSRFSRGVCQQFAEHLASRGSGIRDVQRFTSYLYLCGEQDGRIACFLERVGSSEGTGEVPHGGDSGAPDKLDSPPTAKDAEGRRESSLRKFRSA